MTKTEAMALLKENRNERGLANWNKMGADTGGLKSFGIGLTQLRKLAKKIGRDHKLAGQLWNTDNHDAKVVGLLIDEPKKLTREQIEEQVEGISAGMLAHVFSSCDATLAKAPFVFECAKDWIKSKDKTRRQCGYGLVYELSKNNRNKDLTDEFFLKVIADIDHFSLDAARQGAARPSGPPTSMLTLSPSMRHAARDFDSDSVLTERPFTSSAMILSPRGMAASIASPS